MCPLQRKTRPEQDEVILGVDTHLDTHVGAVISGTGKLLGTQSVPADTSMLTGQAIKHAQFLCQCQPALSQQAQRGRQRLQHWRVAQRAQAGGGLQRIPPSSLSETVHGSPVVH